MKTLVDVAIDVRPEAVTVRPIRYERKAKLERALRDVGRPGGPRVARGKARVRQAGEHRRDHRHDERQPDGIAHLPGRLADRAVDARADHVAHAVDDEREQAHRAQ